MLELIGLILVIYFGYKFLVVDERKKGQSPNR